MPLLSFSPCAKLWDRTEMVLTEITEATEIY